MAAERRTAAKVFTLLSALCREPAWLKVVWRDWRLKPRKLGADVEHLRAAMEWLCRAQDSVGGGGVSGGYDYHQGWLPPYPETTGYIIPTFLQYAVFSGESGYVERALRMGDWEIEIQLPSGAIRGGMGVNEYPIVFNTGQVISGWTSLYKETGESRFLEAAARAADWLVAIQDEDGKWSQYTLKDIPHAYNTRVAWPLLEVYALTGVDKYYQAAESQILWALGHARENGWISQMAFAADETPLTHTIAYTLRGLLESSFHLTEEVAQKALHIVQIASENTMRTYEFRKSDPYSLPRYLPATLNEEWKSRDNFSCLTGDAQIAGIWLKVYKLTGDARFLNSALKLLDQVKATQCLNDRNSSIRGGIAGSYPLWGKYAPFNYPNWAAKFFADSLMLQESIMRELEGRTQ